MRPKDKRKLEHGTLDGYKAYGCRCSKCREIWELYQQEFRDSVYDETKAKTKPIKIKDINFDKAYTEYIVDKDMYA